MARIRTIKPEFWEDETVATLSRDARLLFIATFNMADDEGLLRWTPDFIKAQVFMYDHDLTLEGITTIMKEITDAGLLYPYLGGKLNQRLACIINFHRHQKINRPQPSKLPFPSLQNSQVRDMYARRDSWQCHLCGEPINENPLTYERYNLSIDHLVPKNEGGSDAPSNIKASHQSCNKSRGAKPLDNSLNEAVNYAVNGSDPNSLSDSGPRAYAPEVEVEVEAEAEAEAEGNLVQGSGGGIARVGENREVSAPPAPLFEDKSSFPAPAPLSSPMPLPAKNGAVQARASPPTPLRPYKSPVKSICNTCKMVLSDGEGHDPDYPCGRPKVDRGLTSVVMPAFSAEDEKDLLAQKWTLLEIDAARREVGLRMEKGKPRPDNLKTYLLKILPDIRNGKILSGKGVTHEQRPAKPAAPG